MGLIMVTILINVILLRIYTKHLTQELEIFETRIDKKLLLLKDKITE